MISYSSKYSKKTAGMDNDICEIQHHMAQILPENHPHNVKNHQKQQRREGHKDKVPGHRLLQGAAGIFRSKARGVSKQNAPSFGVQLDHLNAKHDNAEYGKETFAKMFF